MLKNSKFVLFLSPQKVGQARNFWILLRRYRLVEGAYCPLFSGSSSLVTVRQSIRRNIRKDFNLHTSLDTGRHSLLSGPNNGFQFAQHCFGYVPVFYS